MAVGEYGDKEKDYNPQYELNKSINEEIQELIGCIGDLRKQVNQLRTDIDAIAEGLLLHGDALAKEDGTYVE